MRRLAALLIASVCLAQSPTAEITGRVTDPKNALIPGAKVVSRNTSKGATRETTTNESGYYTIPVLEPGDYEVSVQSPGFKPVTRSGIVLQVNQTARIDFALDIGDVKETVIVAADALLIQADNAALGAVVDNKKISDLPLNGRNPFDLIALTPGTTFYARPDLPGNNIPLSNFSTNGGPALTNEVLLDGLPDTVGQFNQVGVIPSIDAVQEFKVQTNNFGAEFGRTGGGVINVSLKSGTNQFHGVAYDFLRNDAFDANNWFNNRAGKSRPPFRFNEFGGNVGGPILHDRTFFFLDYEGLQRNIGRTYLFTVPTLDMRQGDFSRLRDTAGNPLRIFDPLTTRPTADGSGRVRDMFPGNVIPRNRFDPAALAMLRYWAPPNTPGDQRTGANNFISTESEKYSTNQVNARFDRNIGRNHQLFGRVSWNDTLVVPPNVFGNIANPASGPQSFTQWNMGANDTWTVTPSAVATFRMGYTRLHDNGRPLGVGFDIRQIGFPASYADAQVVKEFPQVNVTGMSVSNIGFGTSSLGPVNSALLNNVPNAYTAATDWTLVRGRHVVKIGADARLFRYSGTRPSNGGGTFSFTSGFTQGPDPNRAASGNPFASYLLGTPSTGTIQIRSNQDYQSYYLAQFVQDDFKVTPTLTLNLGLRYEYESALTDRYNRLTYFDPTASNAVLSQAAGRPILGGIGFVNSNGAPRNVVDVPRRNWGPRFGFAYRIRNSTVVRGGYGIYYPARTGRDGVYAGQEGYSSTTNMITSVDGFTPVNFLQDPFPKGQTPPSRNTLGLLTNAGQAVNSAVRHQRAVYIQQWNFSVQRTLPGAILLETSYAGSKGTHLVGDIQLDQISDNELARGNDLLRLVPNPFFGIIPANASLGLPTIALGQLLRPYPQYTGVTASDSAYSSSVYHSLQVRTERRFSNGFTFLASYTFGKLIDDGSPGRLAFLGNVPSYQNSNNRHQERSVSTQDVSRRLVLSYVYELPFGQGKRFLNGSGLSGKLVGGWQINGISTFQTGIPLSLDVASNPTLGRVGVGTLRPDNNGKSAKLEGPIEGRLDRYFDTSVFSQPAVWQFGNTARTLPDVRAPGIQDFDVSLVKNTIFVERYRIQFRTEAFNVLNHPNFGIPGTTLGAPGFGVINSAAPARILQLAVKAYF